MLNIGFPFVDSAFQPKKKQVFRLHTPHILGFASSEELKIAEIAIQAGSIDQYWDCVRRGDVR